VFTATELAQPQGSAVWQVKTLCGFVAPLARAGEASALLARVAASFRIDPAWLSAYQHTTRAMSEVVLRSGQVLSEAIHGRYRAEQATAASIEARYRNASAAEDRNHQGAVEAVRFVHTYVDPENPGRTYELDDRYGHRWVGPGHGEPVPSDSSRPPFPGARELEVVSPHRA